MTTQSVQTLDGDNVRPAYTFEADPDTGFFRVASGQIAITSNGKVIATFTNSGLVLADDASLTLLDSTEQITVGGTTSGTGSRQGVAADLTIADNTGHTGGYLAGVMGNVFTSGATDVNSSNVAGVVGKATIQGQPSEEVHPIAGVIGEASGKAHAAVVGTVSDTDGSAGNPSVIDAVFKAEGQFANDYGTSTVDYGLDLKSAAHDVYQTLAYAKAAIRLPNDVVIMTGSGNPTNGVTGDNFAGVGSIYINISAGTFFRNTGAIDNPTWTSGL